MRLNPDCIRDILLQTEKGFFILPNRAKIQEMYFENLEFLKNYSSIEILEPQNLREKLRNELESTLKIYKNKEEKNA